MQTNTISHKLPRVIWLTIFAVILPLLAHGQTLSISSVDNVSEDGSTLTFTVSIAAAHTHNINADYAITGTVDGYDYSHNESSIEILIGATEATIVIDITDDQLVEVSEDLTVTLSNGTDGQAPNNISASPANKTVSIVDNDVASFTLTSTSDPIEITEEETAQTFTLVLNAQPASTVVIDVSSDNAAATVTPTSMSFDNGDWNQAQTVTINAPHDDNATSEAAVITAVINAGTSNDLFDLVPSQSIDVNVTDNETPDFTLTSTTDPIVITEEGAAQTFTVVLNTQPTTPVVIDIASDNPAATVSSASLSFTNGNWDQAQTITIEAPNDANVINENATITCSINIGSSDGTYNGVSNQTITVNVTDNDGEISISDIINGDEAGTNAGFTINTTQQFASPTVFTYSITPNPATETDDFTIGSVTLAANTSSFPVPIYIVDDNLVEGSESFTITIDGSDNASAILDAADFANISITDNDAAGFTLTPLGPISITEQSTAETFTVILNTQPTTPVVIDIASDNPAATVSSASLSFTNGNWDQAQTITIEAPHDANVINENATITCSINIGSSDGTYNAVSNQTIAVNVTDNDSEISISDIINGDEAGTNAGFTINTTQQFALPTVFTYAISANTATETDDFTVGSVTLAANTSSLIVPITIVDDALVEGSESFTITIDGSDNASAILDAADFANISIADNDAAGFTLSPAGPINITEQGTTETFTVVLDAQPINNVYIDVSSNNATAASVDESQLTFTNGNWNEAQTVTITAPNDANLSDEQITITTSINDNFSDNAFDPLADQLITVNVTDNDGELTISQSQDGAEGGTNASFRISTSRRFDTETIITVTTSSNSAVIGDDFTIGSITLPINADFIDVPLTIVNDNLIESDETVTVTLDTEDNDNAEIGTANNALITITDNDEAGYTLSSSSINITEGNTQQFTIVLDAQPLSAVSFNITSNNTNVVTVNNPSITFAPEDYNIAQSITLTSPEDVNLVGETTTVNVAVNDGTSDDSFDTLLDQSITINSSDNDAPGYTVSTGTLAIIEGDTQQFTVVLTAQPQNDVLVDISSVNTLVATVDNAQLTFNNSNWNIAQTITVTIPEDANLDNETTNIIASINNTSDADFTGIAGQTITVNTTDNDTAPVFTSTPIEAIDEDVLYTYSITVTDEDNDIPVISIETPVNWLTLTDNGDGSATLTGTPENDDVANYTIRIRATDDLTFTEQEFELVVNNINDVPIANDDSDITSDIMAVSTNVLANDVDDDGNFDLTSLTVIQNPDHGSVEVEDGTGHIIFTPDLRYFGIDSYRYRICDTDGACDEATVTINVVNGNVEPNTNKDYITTNEDTRTTISPLTNDIDPNGNIDIQSLQLTRTPDFGTYSINKTEAIISYQPNPNYFGNDTIVYTVCDLGSPSLCSEDSIFIEVLPINDAPVAVDHHVNVVEGIPAEINLTLIGSDIDNDILSIEIDPNSPIIPGTKRIINNFTTLEFTAEFGTLCTDLEIWYILKDDGGASSSAKLFIHITAIDSDSDNIPDAIEIENGVKIDTDGDGTPNYLDEDSDDDGISDLIEGGITNSCEDIVLDSDNDGIPDYMDTNSDNDELSDKEEGNEDCDNDGIPNFRDSFDNCSSRINAPDVFTPNGDGKNDFFVIKGATSDELKANELFIFNRWGGQVYNMVNYDNTWDGKSNSGTLGSEELSEGTYFYVFKTNAGKILKGTVYIKR